MSSRKEEQRLRKERKQEAERRRQSMQSWLVKGAIVILVPLALYVFFRGIFGGAPVLPPDVVVEGDHVRGAAEAPVTLTVYADFQCPACRSEALLIARAWPQLQDGTRQVFRHFPLDSHPHSFLAARYAEAAGRQGRFWEMHDKLFLNQQNWAPLDEEGARQVFNNYALELVLDMDRLLADVEADEVRDKIVADRQGGLRAGVRGTPALFVNGRPIDNHSTVSQLVESIERARP